jgi:DNA-binding ferritin-like protein
MEIEIITTSAIENVLDPTKKLGIVLNKATSVLKMLHWYVLDHNAHEILGELYDDLTDLFDKLQEEVIGTCKGGNALFPLLEMQIPIDDISAYTDNQSIMDEYVNVMNAIRNILTSLEFNNYISNVKSGLNNTKEDILSRINKADYLLAMIKF